MFIFLIYISYVSGLEEVMEFLKSSCPDVEIAIAHGKVNFCFAN